MVDNYPAGRGLTDTAIVQVQNGGAVPFGVSTLGTKATYSAAVTALALAATATDFFTITGSATKTVSLLRVAISGIGTTALATAVQLVKRSAANTSGASSAATAVPHDSTNGAATATVLSYTTNPTLGTAVGIVRSTVVSFPVATGAAAPASVIFGNANDQPIVLRGIAQVLGLNLNGVTVLGGAVSVEIEWTEE